MRAPQRAEILAKLSTAEIAHLVARPVTQSELRRLRRELRAEGFRAALPALFPELPITRAAKALARALDRYLASTWRQDRDSDEPPPDAGLRRVTLFRLAQLSDGLPLSWTRIYEITTDRH